MRISVSPWLLLSILLLPHSRVQAQRRLEPLTVSADGHSLVRAAAGQKGTRPFFWLGDTAWNLFGRLDREEAQRYLDDRAAKKFTVIQAHLLAWALPDSNAYGQTAFVNDDFDQPNEAYWQHVDYILEQATRRGLYVAALPAWCRTYIEPASSPLHGDSLKAYRYARFLGQRYRAYPNLIWILGGDQRPTRHAVYRQLARGLTETYADGNPDRILLTYHPPGGTYRPPATSSGEFYHNEFWLDFNLIQSGHALENKNYERISEDYRRWPIKPTLDSEPCYEQHPVKHNFNNGRFTAWHLRRRAYWSVLAGACGFTYGGNGLWQMDKPGKVLLTTHFSHYWYDALNHEGAGQMQYLRSLIERTGPLVPDSTTLRGPAGTVDDRVQVARDAHNRFRVAYVTDGHPVEMDLSSFRRRRMAGFWLNPRTGAQQSTVPIRQQGVVSFTPPTSGPEQDWVLVLNAKKP